jgi:hypothetical protein
LILGRRDGKMRIWFIGVEKIMNEMILTLFVMLLFLLGVTARA